MRFINREKEISALDGWWRDNVERGRLVIVYGRRRIGKTKLCLEFIKGKPCVYFVAEQLPAPHQLKELSRQIGEYFRDDILISRGAADWQQLFKYIADKKERLALVIDEFPYLIESEKAIASVFQKGWDLYLKNSPIFLILSGSSISMMQEYALDYRAPLYGRRTGQIELQPLPFSALRQAFPKRSFEERIEIFSVTGGIPAYLELFDNDDALKEILKRTVFQRAHFMSREVEFLLRQELREPRTYFAILSAIANKCTRLSEIMNQTGLDKTAISRYLGILAELGFVCREVPVTEKYPGRSKQGNYAIRDSYTGFWFQTVFHNQDKLEREDTEKLAEMYERTLPERLARAYESACREFIWERGSGFFIPERVGRWWDGKNEIDITAISERENKILFGEVKWSAEPVDVPVLERLKVSAESVVWGNRNTQKYYSLFSRSGFSAAVQKRANAEGIILVEGENIISPKHP